MRPNRKPDTIISISRALIICTLITITSLRQTSGSIPFLTAQTYHVNITNMMSPGRSIGFHCKSNKGRDFGSHQIIDERGTYVFGFYVKFLRKVTCSCNFTSGPDRLYDIMVFSSRHSFYDHCGIDALLGGQTCCYWEIRDDGAFLHNLKHDLYEFRGPWQR